jgi:hypothetical protein
MDATKTTNQEPIMLRKLLLSAAAGAALLSPLAFSGQADAGHDFFRRTRIFRGHVHRCHYHVLFRHCCYDPWQCYGTYGCYHDAADAACLLRHRGLEVRISSH